MSSTPSPDAGGVARSAVVLLAAGEGRRVGADVNKVLLPLAGAPVFVWSLRAIGEVEYVDQVVLVVREQDRELVTRHLERTSRFDRSGSITVVTGGTSRHGSEWNALQSLAPDIDNGLIDVVAIHDAARPLVDPVLFRQVVDVAAEYGGALPVRAQTALMDRHGADRPGAPVETGTELVAVQTPQAFAARPLLEAYRQADRDGYEGTDTAGCIERYTHLDIHCVPCPATNLKITFPEDVALAERLLEKLGRM